MRCRDGARLTARAIRGALACAATLGISPTTARAQSCTPLPVGPDEVWMGAAAWYGAESPLWDFSFDASVAGKGFLSGGISVGGFDEERAPSSIGILLGALWGPGSARLCTYVRGEFLNYSFNDRHALDRGEGNTGIGELGVRTYHGLPFSIGAARLGLMGNLGMAYRSLDVRGRRLVIGPEVSVEEVHSIMHDVVLIAGAGVQLRLGRFGGAVGIRRRPSYEDRWIGFVRLGVALAQLEWS